MSTSVQTSFFDLNNGVLIFTPRHSCLAANLAAIFIHGLFYTSALHQTPLVLTRRIQLNLANNLINLGHDLWCKLVHNLQSRTVVNNLLWSGSACNDCRDIWVLQAPRERKLRLTDTKAIGDGLWNVSEEKK